MKEGKDAWKKRKAALEEVEAVCNQYNGLISSSPDSFKSLVELIKALKSRLGDSQSNLKPLAVKNIAAILSSVDGPAQGKLGKIVYKSLIAAAMNENKKIMRDASIDALKNATMKSEIDGGGINKFAMEPFMNAFATELNESGVKVGIFIFHNIRGINIIYLYLHFQSRCLPGCWFANRAGNNIRKNLILPKG